MSRQFMLHVQQPRKATKIGLGVLTVDKNGSCLFFEGQADSDARILAELNRARIEFAGADGIMLSGVEPKGFDAQGRQKYAYQEWWLAYT